MSQTKLYTHTKPQANFSVIYTNFYGFGGGQEEESFCIGMQEKLPELSPHLISY
jgi:hypothetical protein